MRGRGEYEKVLLAKSRDSEEGKAKVDRARQLTDAQWPGKLLPDNCNLSDGLRLSISQRCSEWIDAHSGNYVGETQPLQRELIKAQFGVRNCFTLFITHFPIPTHPRRRGC
jgi:hypothetical protein